MHSDRPIVEQIPSWHTPFKQALPLPQYVPFGLGSGCGHSKLSPVKQWLRKIGSQWKAQGIKYTNFFTFIRARSQIPVHGRSGCSPCLPGASNNAAAQYSRRKNTIHPRVFTINGQCVTCASYLWTRWFSTTSLAWEYIKVCGYSDRFCKNLNQRLLTPRWSLTPHLLHIKTFGIFQKRNFPSFSCMPNNSLNKGNVC